MPPWKLRSKAKSASSSSDRPSSSVWKFIWQDSIFLSQAPYLGIGSLALLASSYCNQSLPKLLGALIDQEQRPSANDSSLYTSFAWIVLGGGLASFIRTSILESVQGTVAAQLRIQAWRVLLTQKELEWFHQPAVVEEEEENDKTESKKATNSENASDSDQSNNQQSSSSDSQDVVSSNSSGVTPAALGTLLEHDVTQLASLYTTTLASLVRGISAVTYSTWQMIQLDPYLFGYSLALIPAVGTMAMVLRKSIKKAQQRQAHLQAQAASFVQERVLRIAMVHLSNRQEDECDNYQQLQQALLREQTTVARMQGGYMGFLFIASATSLLGVVHKGQTSIAQGRITSGELTQFATFSFLLGLGTSGLVKAASEMNHATVAAERYYGWVNTTPNDHASTEREPLVLSDDINNENDDKPDTAIPQVDSINMNNVSFAYKSNPQKTILHDISLTLERGKVVALVGPNGSGKTTLASVLAGLYAPTKGSVDCISLDERQKRPLNLLQLTPKQRSSLVHMLSQTTALLDTSILENVRYSKPSATVEEVQSALNQANCSKPLDYRVGFNGTNLSGGQCQRVALARAILAKPQLFLLDEPAASLDRDGQLAVEDTVVRQKANSAILLIVHHAATLALADTIVVLNEGRIVEQGTLSELTAKEDSHLLKIMPELSEESKDDSAP